MSSLVKKLPVVSDAASTGDAIGEELFGATSHDLVFAVVGHTGAGASRVCQAFVECLEDFTYKVHVLKMSELIHEVGRRHGLEVLRDTQSRARLARTRRLQDAGNWLRAGYGAAFTAGLAIRKMHRERQKNSSQKNSSENQPLVFVIDSPACSSQA